MYRRRAKSANTTRAYVSNWRQFEVWCDERDLDPIPARAEAVATWPAVLAQAGSADSTIRHDLQRYRGRHLIENAFCCLKNFRRVATR